MTPWASTLRIADLVDRSFEPRRLLGSALTTRPFRAAEIDDLARTFQAFTCGEKKGLFVSVLRNSLAHSDRSTGWLIIDDNERPLGLLVMDTAESETRIRLLRTTAGAVADVLARHLVWLAVQTARRAGHRITRLLDPHISSAANGVLGVVGFRPAREGIVKVNGIGVRTAPALADHLVALRSVYRNDFWIRNTTRVLAQEPGLIPPDFAFQYERVTWPAKLLDTTLQSFIVPIRPEWAAHLFHEKLAEQGLFGVDPRLMLRLDNVYYRSAVPGCIEAPARVLWYVTASKESPDTGCIAATSLVEDVVHGPAKGVFARFKRYGVFEWSDVLDLAKGNPNGTVQAFRFGCIAATSLVEDVVHGPAKGVFARFKRYGVFEWSDVLDLAKGNPNGTVQAFRFGHTEPFDTPVELSRIRQLALQTGMGNLVFQSPSRVSSEFFGAVYGEGFGDHE